MSTHRLLSAAFIVGAAAAVLSGCRPIGTNLPPDRPAAPLAPASGRSDSTYTILAVVPSDPDTDSVALRLDLGDGEVTAWTELLTSGDTASTSHRWRMGVFSLRVQARDAYGVLTDWSIPCTLRIRPATAFPTAPIGIIVLPYDGNEDATITPDGRLAFFLGSLDGISVIDTEADTFFCFLSLPNPRSMSLTANGELLYVLYEDSVAAIQTRDMTITRRVPRSWRARDIAVTPDGSKLYCAHWRDSIYVVRVSDMAVDTAIPVRTDAEMVVCRPDGQYVYIGGGDSIAVIRTSDNAVTQYIPAPSNWPMAILPSGEYLYVCCYGLGILVIRTSNNQLVATMPMNEPPSSITASADGQYVFATRDDIVFVISTSLNEVVEEIEFCGCECYHPIVILPDLSKFYVVTHEVVYVFGQADAP